MNDSPRDSENMSGATGATHLWLASGTSEDATQPAANAPAEWGSDEVEPFACSTQDLTVVPRSAAGHLASGSLEVELLREIEKIPILDPHSHIDPRAAVSRSLDDLLGYHYYTELAHSAGMNRDRVKSDVSPANRVAAIAEYLPEIENTVQYTWLVEIAQAFFDFQGDMLTASNIGELYDAVARKSGAGWEAEVLKRSNVERVFLTNEFDASLQGFDTHRYIPCLRTDDLVFRLRERSTIDRLRRATDSDVGDADTLVKAIGRLFENFVQLGARACAVSLPPDFEPAAVERIALATAIRSMLSGRPTSSDEARAVSRFVFWTLVAYAAQFRLPFDLMIGVNRKVYRDGVFQGQDLFDQRTSLCQYRELFNAFPQVTFPISVLSSPQNQELVAHSWIFPNVVTHGHWWYSNVPAYIEPDARARLTAVPANKQIGYYSDAYKLEFILPKFNMYRRILARILACDFVTERGWSEERAIAFARRVLRTNAERIFGVTDLEAVDRKEMSEDVVALDQLR